VAGVNSPKKENYPHYMAPDGENFRGINAVRVLGETKQYNLDKVIAAGYDRRMAAFEVLIPALLNAFEKKSDFPDSLNGLLGMPMMILKNWDYRCGELSVATTLAIEWAQRLLPAMLQVKIVDDEEADQVEKFTYYAKTAPARDLLYPMLATLRDLEKRFGRWEVSWGNINRFQRISPAIENIFNDYKESLPVPFASSAWGTLPSYTSRVFPGTVKRYGVHGNSFICAVEFGKKIKAKSLLAGGESGDANSPHFFDQGIMYSKGAFKNVLFYKEKH
jgi:acyl-homoserine lactone acylase PvdQ